MTHVDEYIDALRAARADGLTDLAALVGDGAIGKLEAAMRTVVDVPFAVATASATSALAAGLAPLDVQSGDEVITSSLDWGAATAAIRSCGALPVYADVSAASGTIDPDDVRRRISPATGAIIATHVFGVPADLTTLAAVASEHGLALVEDCAQSLGARHRGRPIGSFGDVSVFSFGHHKPIDADEGGMLTCHDPATYRRAVRLTQHPVRQILADVPPDDTHVHARMHPVAAVLAARKLRDLDTLVVRRAVEHQRVLEAARSHGLAVRPLRPMDSDVAVWHRHPVALRTGPADGPDTHVRLVPADRTLLRDAERPCARDFVRHLAFLTPNQPQPFGRTYNGTGDIHPEVST